MPEGKGYGPKKKSEVAEKRDFLKRSGAGNIFNDPFNAGKPPPPPPKKKKRGK